MNYGPSKSAKIVLFCKKHFFLTSIFKPLYFLKSCPILTNWCSPYSQNLIVISYRFLAKKSCFLGPTIFKLHNWTDINLQAHQKIDTVTECQIWQENDVLMSLVTYDTFFCSRSQKTVGYNWMPYMYLLHFFVTSNEIDYFWITIDWFFPQTTF